jgi:Cu(I)/Ag(I) efflux system membrane fusion protein
MAVAVLVVSCERHEDQSKPADVDYYTCTMHPSVRKQSPKDKCPICGMNLEPVRKRGAQAVHQHEPMKSDGKGGSSEERTNTQTGQGRKEEEEAPTEFTVPVARLQQIGVTYATIAKQSFQRSLRAVGLVASDKQRQWDYVARVDGYVKQLFVSSRGELLEKGAPLLTLYSPELLTTQKELIDLLQRREQAQQTGNPAVLESTERLYQSAQQRLRLWNISDQEIRALEKTRQPQEYLTLFSPFHGVVQDLAVEQGRRVMIGDHLVELADLSVVWVWAQFYQDDLPLLQKSLPATITTSSFPGERFGGKFAVVDPFLNEATRTGRVRIDVENLDFKLRPGMYVNVELSLDMGEGLGVPASAVLPTGRRNVVFVDKGEGKLEPRFIELGRMYGDFYEVKSGLKEMDRVVTSANFLIDAEAKVQGALKLW